MDDRPTPPSPTPPPGEPPARPAPDRGSPFLAKFALLATILCLAATFALQQRSAAQPEAAPVAGIRPPGPDDLGAFVCKVMLKLQRLSVGQGSASPQLQSSAQAEDMMLENVDAAAFAPQEKLRAAVVVAEIAGAAKASERLRKLKDELGDPGKFRRWAEVPDADRAVLAKDADTLLDLYASPGPLDPAAAADLEARHGYFGRVAAVWGKPDTDPARQKLFDGAGGIIAFFVGMVLFGGVVFLGSLGCFITALILIGMGRIKPRFVRPTPGGSVYLETVAVFFGGFLTLKIVHEVLEQTKWIQGPAAGYLILGVQWGLAAVVAWPLLRGVPLAEWRRQVGLHCGGGVVKEAFCGLGAYLAGLPLLLVALWVTLQLMRFAGGGQGAPQHNAVFDGIAQGGATLALIFALATIWAPLVEELVFRGSLYRHLRGTLGVFLSAAISAVVFGAAHGYQWFALGPVMAIGFNFAIIREWRGSLIGPIVMHALNNATVLVIVLSLFTLMKD